MKRKHKSKRNFRTPPVRIIRRIPYTCPLCGEDREGNFLEINGRVRCTVCGFPATVDEEVTEE